MRNTGRPGQASALDTTLRDLYVATGPSRRWPEPSTEESPSHGVSEGPVHRRPAGDLPLAGRAPRDIWDNDDRGTVPTNWTIDPLLADVGWNRDAPRFVAAAIQAWNWPPTEVVKLAESLDDRFEIVRGDVFFDLLKRTLS
ncbi:hypothetical protein ACWDWO_24730 [Actinopolymorpha singaporensis]